MVGAPQAGTGDAVASSAPSASAMRAEGGSASGLSMGSSGGGTGEAGGAGPVAAQGLPPIDAGKVVKSATLALDVKEGGFETAHDKALRAVEDAGGFVQSSESNTTRLNLTIRVPADSFESTLTRLRELGEVKDESVSGQDVTEEYVDLDARLRHWRAQEAVFLELLSRAGTIAETVEVRRELSVIQQTIEQLEGRIRFLDDRTGFSTVSLVIAVAGAPASSDGESPSLAKAWDQARDAAVAVVGGTLVTLGVVVPLAGIIGVPALLIWLATRRRRTPAAVPAT